MKSERLQVSVAMCTYNGSRYLEEQLRSIFEQTLPPDLTENRNGDTAPPYHSLFADIQDN